MSWDDARAVADSVLFEGYALYPYRPSSKKNVSRWQFGVVAPRAFSEEDGGDPWWIEAQVLLRPSGAWQVQGQLRFLRLRRRQILAPDPVEIVEAGGDLFVSWDEGEPREIDFHLDSRSGEATFALPGDLESEEAGAVRVERRRSTVAGVIRYESEGVEAAEACVRLRVRVENRSPWRRGGGRAEAMGSSLLGAHLLMRVTSGSFLSLFDPPAWAVGAASTCKNVRLFPVLAGPAGAEDLVLASPIILYDHPAVAPESPGDLFDATEIDEILTLRTRAMTEGEKREARATDPRIAALVARSDALPREALARLHGTFRAPAPRPPEEDGRASPSEGYAPGDRVRLRPRRRADAQDMFLEGRIATVRSLLREVDGRLCLAVTLEDDPAAELHLAHGRFHYFFEDEVEPLAPITSS